MDDENRTVTFAVSRRLLARLDAEAYRRTVASGGVVTRSKVLRELIEHVCPAQEPQGAA
jgi:hypothetical protein